MKKIKVFFIAAANSIHTVRWVNALSNKFEIHLIYCKDHKPNIDKINSDIVLHELKIVSPLGYYLNFIELKRLYRKIKPDLINIHYASGYGTLVRMAKIQPTLISIWGSDVYDFPNESKWKEKILRKNILNAGYIASTSKAMAEELKKNVNIENRELFITPFGVDVDKFKRIESRREDHDFKIGNIKTLEPKYGIEYAILAVKKLKDRLIQNNEMDLAKSIKLYLYGSGKQKEELEKLIIDNQLKDCVFLMGKIPNVEVPNILNGLDVFCATSVLNSESFGVAVVEAMACEVPVIATKVDGFSEVMEDNVTGILVEKKNVEQISQALEKMLRNCLLRKKYGKNGRERVLKYYSWKDNVNTMENIYEKIVKIETKRRNEK